jgi:hypothetical protein
MFQLAFKWATDQMSHPLPSSRGSSTCITDINSETLTFLILSCGECIMKESSVLNGIGGSRKGEKMCKMTQEVGS